VIVVDTNVISEVVRLEPSSAVMGWLAYPPDDIAVCSVTIGELLTGIGMLPDGARRRGLAEAVEGELLKFAVRLPYDESAARAYAEVCALARRAGRALHTEDGMIAAICVSWGARLATRNVKDFDFLPISVVNPWDVQ